MSSGDTFHGEVQALMIGEVGIVGMPGEPFVEIGLRVLNISDFKSTMVAGYANSYDPGYIPTYVAYAEGQYEIHQSIVAPGADELLFRASRAALNRLG